MSPDEGFVTVAACFLGPILWAVWWFRVRQAAAPRAPAFATRMAITVVVLGGFLVAVLTGAASEDVRGAPQYLFMYTVLGFAWLKVAELGFAYVGISARDDAIERGNAAAGEAVTGALVGVTLCYAGGNIGNGPGWWVVVFSAALATCTLAAAWLILDRLTGVNDVVTIDRDRAAGLRLGAFLIACGLLLGRGVAGDWVSVDFTVVDFARFLPAVALLILIAVLIERVARPTPERPRTPVAAGVGAGIIYVALAAAYVRSVGWLP
jgi:uncharacterized membrane protein YjfL (UPF0719 family)